MALQERSELERVAEVRAQVVARGVSTPALVVDRARGALIWDADGREYIDFAGGIGCQNLGHGHPAILEAVHAQVDRYLMPRARELGEIVRARLERIAPAGADVRGLGPMLAIELPDQSPDRASAVVAAAREQGLVLLSCGLYGNVIRLHVPLVIDDAELERGLAILERALAGS